MENPEPQFLYLTTVGRRTGQDREIEIWFTELDGRYYVISEHRERSHWVRNLIQEPAVRFRVGDARFAGRARIVDPMLEPDLAAAVAARSIEKYGWGDGLIVQLAPDRRLD